jgi:hypothetical protein
MTDLEKWKLEDDSDEVIEILEGVPGVKEFMRSFPVTSGLEILKKRMSMKKSQEELCQYIQAKTGLELSQDELHQMEWGDGNIPVAKYQTVLQALGLQEESQIKKAMN